MADLDTDLRNRLSRLADAVPVAPGRLDPVHQGAVATRQRIRMAWVTPLVLLVAIGLGSSLLNQGFGPGRRDPDAPRRSTVVNGDFELSVDATKGAFRTGEQIDVRAALVYRGPNENVTIGYGALGAIVFTIPGILSSSSPPDVCEELVLERGVPLTGRISTVRGTPEAFRLPHGIYDITGQAAFRVGDCRAGVAELQTMVTISVAEDEHDIPIRTVPHEGGACPLKHNSGWLVVHHETGLGVRNADGMVRGATWPYGYSAHRGADGVGVLVDAGGGLVAREEEKISFGGAFGMEGLIAPCLVAGPHPPVTPEPTPAPRPEDVQVATSENGTFRLEVRSTRSIYTGEPIAITASYTYLGPHESIVVSHFAPEVGFAIEQQGVESTVGWIKLYDSACTELRLERGVPREVQLVESNMMSLRAASLPAALRLRPEPLPRDSLDLLPTGTWRITASLANAVGPCSDRGSERGLGTSIEVVVGA